MSKKFAKNYCCFSQYYVVVEKEDWKLHPGGTHLLPEG